MCVFERDTLHLQNFVVLRGDFIFAYLGVKLFMIEPVDSHATSNQIHRAVFHWQPFSSAIPVMEEIKHVTVKAAN